MSASAHTSVKGFLNHCRDRLMLAYQRLLKFHSALCHSIKMYRLLPLLGIRSQALCFPHRINHGQMSASGMESNHNHDCSHVSHASFLLLAAIDQRH